MQRVTFIRRCCEFGFTIEVVRALLAIVEDRNRPCREAREIAQAHIEHVRARITELRALERMIMASCGGATIRGGGTGPSCVPLQSLAHARRIPPERLRREVTKPSPHAPVEVRTVRFEDGRLR